MSEKRDKTNKKFMLLSAIGIFMVVDHHTFTAFNILGDFLPYNSFFMPMFVFISGYFNKVNNSTNLLTYFMKKIKTLLVPYIGLSLTVFAVQQLINFIKLGSEMDALPSDYLSFVLKRIVTVGSFGAIVEPMWFVIALFATLMIYAVLKKFLYKIWNSYIMFVLFCGLQIFVIYLVKNTNPSTIENFLVPLKCLFFYPFLEMGSIYRDHLEKKHTAMPCEGKIALLFILLVLNMIRTTYLPYAYDIAFDSIDNLSGFTSPYYITPLLSAIIGILFWLTLADMVSKQVYESKFVNYMSCNTFWIMGLHIIFFNIVNCILMLISEHIVEIPYFDVNAFKETEWYFWGISGNIKIIYVIVGVLGPLGLKWVYDKICVYVKGKIEIVRTKSPQKAKTLAVLSKLIYVLLIGIVVIIYILASKSQIDDSIQPDTEHYTDVEIDEPITSVDLTDSAIDDDTPGQILDGNDSEQNTDPEDLDESVNPAYAYISMAYNNNGSEAEYLTEPCAVNGNGTYTVTITREDNEETPLAFAGFSYMGIRLLGDGESPCIDVSEAVITNINVICDGITLKTVETGTVSNDNGGVYNFFDCYDIAKDFSQNDPTEDDVYDFSNRNSIQISFTVSQAKLIEDKK